MLSEKHLELPSLVQARKEIKELLDRYHKFKDDKSFSSNEKQACTSLIVPLIHKVLHWETEDPSEFKTEEGQSGKRIDYCVYNQGISQFIVEAKAPKHDIFDNEIYYKQALEYGYGKEHDFAILTNFKQIVILGCQIKFRVIKETEIARIDLLQATDEDLKLLLNFEKNYWINTGKEKSLYSSLSKHKKTIPLDEQLLEDMKHWREQLLRNIKQKNTDFDFDDDEEFNYIEEEVQKIIDRLIFICYCEDKELNEPQLKRLMFDKNERFSLKVGWLLGKIQEVFAEYRRIYDSDLFDKSKCDAFKIDGAVLLEILSDLREPKGRLTYDFKSIEADILGKTYENFIGHIQSGKKRFTEKEDIGKRKKGGIYYTPKYIVDYIVNNTVREYIHGKSFEEIKKVKILDPACGSGSFLLRAFDILIEESEKSLKRNLKYEEKVNLVLNCIYGVDLDKRACDIAKLNLSLKMAEHGQKLPMLRDNIRMGNSLIDDKNIAGYKAFVWQEEFKEIMADGGFDIVIGNPPWVSIKGKQKSADLSEEELNYLLQKYPCDTYMPNLYEMFMWRSFLLLKEEGLFSFIVPDRLCANQQFINLRKHILEKYSIRKLWFKIPFSGIIADTVVFVVEKKGNIKNIIIISEWNKEIIKLYQKAFLESSDYALFYVNPKVYSIFEKIRKNESAVSLNKVVLTTSGCGAKSLEITKEKKNNRQRLILKGESISRYNIRYKFWFEFIDKNLSGRTRDEKKLGKKLKILLRKTGSDLIATFDGSGNYPEQSLYFLYTENDDQKDILLCLLAILNSKLLNCYYKNFAITNRDSTPQLKNIDLDKFPILLPKNLQPFINLVDRMLSLNKHLNETKNEEEKIKIKKEIKKTDNEIDELVYQLYGITEEEKKIIEESLK